MNDDQVSPARVFAYLLNSYKPIGREEYIFKHFRLVVDLPEIKKVKEKKLAISELDFLNMIHSRLWLKKELGVDGLDYILKELKGRIDILKGND